MPYTTSVAGTVITAAWANANVRDQAVTPFASAAARNSAISSPVVGMVEYLATNDLAEGLTTRNSAGQWRLPWNMPWGFVPISAVPAPFNFSTAKGTSGNFTFTTVANRALAIFLNVELANGSATGTVSTIGVETSASVTIASPILRWTLNTASNQDARTGIAVVTSPGSGLQTWRLFATSTLSATTETMSPYFLSIIDLGPASNPA